MAQMLSTVTGTLVTAGEVALAIYVGPEVLAWAGAVAAEGPVGFMEAGHGLAGIGVALAVEPVTMYQGSQGIMDNCGQ
jgi:hypothetical protein